MFLIDRKKNELWTKVAKGTAGSIRLPFGSGIVGYVAKTKETLNIFDAHTDPRFDASFDKKTNYRTKTVLCMPI